VHIHFGFIKMYVVIMKVCENPNFDTRWIFVLFPLIAYVILLEDVVSVSTRLDNTVCQYVS